MKHLLTSLLCILFYAQLCGQGNHYWNHSLNTESSILSSAVVAGGGAESGIFYNPATIVNITESKLSTSANLFSFESYLGENALGTGNDIKIQNIMILPRFISFMIYPKNRRWTIELATFSKQKFNVDYFDAITKEIDILKNQPGNETYYASLAFNREIFNQYIGIGSAFAINKHWSIGGSFFVSYKSFNNLYETDLLAFPAEPDTSLVSFIKSGANYYEKLKFYNFRVLWKLGVLFKKGNWKIGLNITPPSLNVIQSGLATRKIEISNISLPDGNQINDVIAVKFTDRIKSNFKDPFSVSLGIAYESKSKSNIYFSAEFFKEIEPYLLSKPNEDNGFTVEENQFLSWAYGAKTIVNLAFGYSFKLNSTTLLLGGFRTDFDFQKDFDYGNFNEFIQLKNFSFNLYHFTFGSKFTIGRAELIVGAEYSFGKNKNLEQLINFENPVEFEETTNLPLQGPRENNMTYKFHSINLLFGFTINKKEENGKTSEAVK